MAGKAQIPDYYQTVMPYLILKDASLFITFAQRVFNAEEKMNHKGDNRETRHAEIVIGDSTIMVGQSSSEHQPQPAGLYINVNNADQSYRKAIDAGAKSVMEPSDQDYGRSCGVKDPCENTWWITSPIE